MATNTSTTKVTLKLLIDGKTKRVLFAEAGKEFVDFLFTLLSFPLGTVIRLLSKNKMVGCLGNLYQSIEDLSDTFIQSATNKDAVLKPKAPFFPNGSTTLLLTDADNNGTTTTKTFYMCPKYHPSVSDNAKAICPQCNNYMSNKVPFIVPPVVKNTSETSGFVKGVVTYMVMDNLEVKPMSTISSLTLLSKFNIQQVGVLEERVIELGMDQGLNLLKASLQTKNVLTSVFLGA
ncbi:hypothetical protein LINGRAHAP2_LOCUS19447 [Linum grandiflorum]